MSQPNSGIFGADFFPTPRKIRRRMMAKIQNKDAKCDLCREIAIATGEEHCPLHPISPQALPAQPAVMIQASETITSMGLFHEPGTCLSCGCLTDGQWCDACASLDLETEVL